MLGSLLSSLLGHAPKATCRWSIAPPCFARLQTSAETQNPLLRHGTCLLEGPKACQQNRRCSCCPTWAPAGNVAAALGWQNCCRTWHAAASAQNSAEAPGAGELLAAIAVEKPVRLQQHLPSYSSNAPGHCQALSSTKFSRLAASTDAAATCVSHFLSRQLSEKQWWWSKLVL